MKFLFIWSRETWCNLRVINSNCCPSLQVWSIWRLLCTPCTQGRNRKVSQRLYLQCYSTNGMNTKLTGTWTCCICNMYVPPRAKICKINAFHSTCPSSSLGVQLSTILLLYCLTWQHLHLRTHWKRASHIKWRLWNRTLIREWSHEVIPQVTTRYETLQHGTVD